MLHRILLRLCACSPHFVIKFWRVLKRFIQYMKAEWAQNKVERTIQKLHCVNRPVRVGFLVVTDACFQFETVFQLMMRCDSFAPMIVVIPNMNLDIKDRNDIYSATFNSLKSKYSNFVVNSRNGDEYLDIATQFDIVATMNPYDSLTHRYYRIQYLATKGIPVILSRYYQEDGSIWSEHLNGLSELSFLWRFYQGNRQILKVTAKAQRLLAKKHRLVAVGEPKVDRLQEKKVVTRNRKKIILAPHHSISPVGDVGLQLSNFLQYAGFILELPNKYPEIDWVFRPHPFLMSAMVSNGFWTEDERSAWLKNLVSFSNVDYMTDGDYYDAFLNSDGMIQDCGSFLPEYFYVNKPQCYVLKDRDHEKKQFTDYGQLLLQHVYRAYNRDEIISFIENVVLKGDDTMEATRKNFTEKVIKFNYPHASETIVEDIKKALKHVEG